MSATRTPQLAMVVDSSKCIDCKGCVASCKVANKVPAGFSRNWIKASAPDFAQGPREPASFQPGGCMHCDVPTCVEACPTGATYKDAKDGSVRIDRSLCIGCGNCIPACPYGARYRHPELRVADKCDYCAARRAQGLEPACVSTCPTKARVFGDLADPDSEAARLLASAGGGVVRVVNPASDTKPNMYYLGGTAPLDWPVQAVMPTPMRMMAGVTPLLRVVLGLSGLGVAALAASQLLRGAGDDHDNGHDNGKES